MLEKIGSDAQVDGPQERKETQKLLDGKVKEIEISLQSKMPGDEFTLKDLVNEENWPDRAGDASELGRQFSYAVRQGRFKVVEVGTNDRNHHIYRMT